MSEDLAIGFVAGFGWGALLAIVACAWVAHVVLSREEP